MKSLENKVIVITGASSGLGESIALQLAKAYCHLVLAARNADKLQKVSEAIKSTNPHAEVMMQVTDVGQEQAVIDLFSSVEQRFGKLDILVNNAGCGHQASIEETTKADWDRIIDTNLTGVFLCSREAIKRFFRKQGFGQVITVCSIAGLYGGPQFSAYCAAKHGVAGLMRSVWLEGRKYGLKTSTIYPARIATPFFDNYTHKPSNKQLISSEEIAEYIILIMQRQTFKRVIKRIAIFFKRIIHLFCKPK